MDRYGVTHLCRGIGVDFPEVVRGPIGWSFTDKSENRLRDESDVEMNYVPGGMWTQGMRSMLTLEDLPISDDGPEDVEDVSNVEETTVKYARVSTILTSGNKCFLSAANRTCGVLELQIDADVQADTHDQLRKQRAPRVADIHVLLQNRLVGFQTLAHERIIDFWLPMMEPYGGELNDFRDASYEELKGRRIIGNSERNYAEWAELDVGEPFYFFSCKSISGWYTYLYTGPAVYCVGRERFRGLAFERDDVVYSLDKLGSFVLNEYNRPIVNLVWQKYPIRDDKVLSRIVCRTDDGGVICAYSMYCAQQGQWSSRVTIEQIRELYNQGKLSPEDTRRMVQAKQIDLAIDDMRHMKKMASVKTELNPFILSPDITGNNPLQNCQEKYSAKCAYAKQILEIGVMGVEYEGTQLLEDGRGVSRGAKVHFVAVNDCVRGFVMQADLKMVTWSPTELFAMTTIKYDRIGTEFTTVKLPWRTRHYLGRRVYTEQGMVRLALVDVKMLGKINRVVPFVYEPLALGRLMLLSRGAFYDVQVCLFV